MNHTLLYRKYIFWMKAPVSKTSEGLALFSMFWERKHSYLFLPLGGLGTAEQQVVFHGHVPSSN